LDQAAAGAQRQPPLAGGHSETRLQFRSRLKNRNFVGRSSGRPAPRPAAFQSHPNGPQIFSMPPPPPPQALPPAISNQRHKKRTSHRRQRLPFIVRLGNGSFARHRTAEFQSTPRVSSSPREGYRRHGRRRPHPTRPEHSDPIAIAPPAKSAGRNLDRQTKITAL